MEGNALEESTNTGKRIAKYPGWSSIINLKTRVCRCPGANTIMRSCTKWRNDSPLISTITLESDFSRTNKTIWLILTSLAFNVHDCNTIQIAGYYFIQCSEIYDTNIARVQHLSDLNAKRFSVTYVRISLWPFIRWIISPPIVRLTEYRVLVLYSYHILDNKFGIRSFNSTEMKCVRNPSVV